VSLVALGLGVFLATEVSRSLLPRRRQGVAALAAAALGCCWLLTGGPSERNAFIRGGGDSFAVADPQSNAAWLAALGTPFAADAPFFQKLGGAQTGRKSLSWTWVRGRGSAWAWGWKWGWGWG